MVTTRSGAGSCCDDRTVSKQDPDSEVTPSLIAPPRRKRARISKAQDGTNSKEVSKGYALTDMPTDILVEIFSGILPGDLLSLSWTCKPFREFLMKKSAASIWSTAEANVPHLPPYPWSNMSPPAYAALLFSKTCSNCGTNTLNDMDPYLLVRFCAVCRMVELAEINKLMPESRLFYKLVVKTHKVQLATKAKERRPRGSGTIQYCLLQDLESIKDAHSTLLRAGCNNAIRRWKEELQQEVKIRNQFALRLLKFAREVNYDRALESQSRIEVRKAEIFRRLLELGWKDEEFNIKHDKDWNALVNQPRPLTDRIWKNILPKLIPLLEKKRKANEAAAKKERRKARVKHFSTLLDFLATQIHPFVPMVETLGFNQEEINAEDSDAASQLVAKFLKGCPFPDLQAALTWPWLAETIEMDVTNEELSDVFCKNIPDMEERACDWRRNIEQQLARAILDERVLSKEFDLDAPSWKDDLTLRVRGSLQPLNWLSCFLLRADTVFCLKDKPCSLKIERICYYPNLVSTFGSSYFSHEGYHHINTESYQRHTMAERVAKAMLKEIKMPDVSYLELAVMGEVFVCERCHLKRAKNWKDMIQHYLDELESWDVSLLVNPRFKTRHPVVMYSAHCLSSITPLIRIAEEQEVNDMALVANQSGSAIVCIPCKNYARMFAATNMEEMECHLDKAHFLSSPAVKGIHYETVDESTNFLQSGGEWKSRWDAYYDEYNN
ncbi:hypothetical protein RSOLAG1IB_10388 [Rhizoctonia solani AG-1 IB]|uniref:F-box domain-containing protein n=1 Tax=Thanatephorus cucumeris (strain AG1-IB / isolate 7/3/14) TaxID=1108050 RepID=A0A0B7FX93_THACB|nr:hypothetical protein RSOLAG1IB_10388 [Rhizoctonia solani AG-1 IB]